uniref:Uncharacterized protein n=1 Tax=Lepeophtheirus salmonis TaxID=72036 RepID=A0A0K2V1H5_LEPSM
MKYSQEFNSFMSAKIQNGSQFFSGLSGFRNILDYSNSRLLSFRYIFPH